MTVTSSTNNKPSLAAKPYTKIILHAAKHPFCETSGLLLAEKNIHSSSSSSLLISDAVPLFHRPNSLTPTAELAVEQVQAYCASNNLRFAGYYVANETPGHALSAPASRFASKLRDTLAVPDFFVLTVDNDALASTCDGKGRPAVVPHVFKENQWRVDTNALCDSPDASSFHVAEDATRTAVQHLSAGLHHRLVDFDDHLDDVRLDWLRNAALWK